MAMYKIVLFIDLILFLFLDASTSTWSLKCVYSLKVQSIVHMDAISQSWARQTRFSQVVLLLIFSEFLSDFERRPCMEIKTSMNCNYHIASHASIMCNVHTDF